MNKLKLKIKNKNFFFTLWVSLKRLILFSVVFTFGKNYFMIFKYKSFMLGQTCSLCTQVLRLGMFEVHCDELIRALSKRAEGLRSRLLVKMCEDHQKENKK